MSLLHFLFQWHLSQTPDKIQVSLKILPLMVMVPVLAAAIVDTPKAVTAKIKFTYFIVAPFNNSFLFSLRLRQ
jgi:hypothetical protein